MELVGHFSRSIYRKHASHIVREFFIWEGLPIGATFVNHRRKFDNYLKIFLYSYDIQTNTTSLEKIKIIFGATPKLQHCAQREKRRESEVKNTLKV